MMRGTMDGKTTVELPPVTVMQAADTSRDSQDGKKSRVTRKQVIIGVTCAVVIAMVIAGVLVGVKFFLDSTNDIVKHTYEFKKENGQSVKEDVSMGIKENYVQYHLKDESSETWVIDDFNRELKVMKVKNAGGSVCYISILNRSESAVPEAVVNASKPDDHVQIKKKNYVAFDTAIKDKSILGSHGQLLCDNVDAYWMTPSCDADSSQLATTNRRQKRGASIVGQYSYIRVHRSGDTWYIVRYTVYKVVFK